MRLLRLGRGGRRKRPWSIRPTRGEWINPWRQPLPVRGRVWVRHATAVNPAKRNGQSPFDDGFIVHPPFFAYQILTVGDPPVAIPPPGLDPEMAYNPSRQRNLANPCSDAGSYREEPRFLYTFHDRSVKF